MNFITEITLLPSRPGRDCPATPPTQPVLAAWQDSPRSTRHTAFTVYLPSALWRFQVNSDCEMGTDGPGTDRGNLEPPMHAHVRDAFWGHRWISYPRRSTENLYRQEERTGSSVMFAVNDNRKRHNVVTLFDFDGQMIFRVGQKTAHSFYSVFIAITLSTLNKFFIILAHIVYTVGNLQLEDILCSYPT